MSRDFAKKKAGRRKPAATPKKPEPQPKSKKGLIYLAIGLIIGLFVAFLVYLDKIPSESKNKRVEFAHPSNQKGKEQKTEKKKSSQQKSKPAKQRQVVKKNEREYDFYEMLPDMQVEVNEPVIAKKPPAKPQKTEPKQSAKTNSNSNRKPETSKNNTAYQLQVGAFQSLDKADSMKARLAFLGIESNISIVWMNSNKKIYRVRIGPSKDTQKLERIKGQLRAQNINAIMQKAL